MACHTPVRHSATDAGTVAGSRTLSVFLLVYCDSIITGLVYRYNVDRVTDVPLHVTEYPSPDSMFCRRQ